MLKYIELNDNKQPVTTFDITHASLEGLSNAGLLLNSKVVVVDFDNDNINEDKIIEYFTTNYPTLTIKTSRGTHLYYSVPKGLLIKNGADKITVGGFQVDYKTGTKSYSIVKYKGKLRESNMPLTLTGLVELPQLLYPLPKTKTNLSGLGDGDGRNNTLFYHLRCIKEWYKDIDFKNVGEYINKNILDDPLKTKELDTLIDSVAHLEVNTGGVYNGDPTNMFEFAKFIIKELDVKIYNGALYIKDGLRYTCDPIKLQRAFAKHLQLRKTQKNELLEQLINYAEYVDKNSTFKVKLRNGVILEDNVIDMDCGFTPFYLDVTYDPTAYDQNVDNFMNFLTCNRKDMRIVLEEILGHCLLVSKFPHKIFFLTGSGANGKSTFIEMITKWAGDLSSHIDIANFDDGTSLTSLIGKIVNIADDVDAIYLEKSKNLKTMASGNTVGARAIYSQPITLKNTATLIFTANEPPTFKDKSDGIGRRVLIVPMENKVKDRIYNLDDLLSTENAKSYILNLALAGVKRIYNNKLELTPSETITNATKQYHLDNDSVLAYLEDKNVVGSPIGTTYDAYVEETEEGNLKAVSLNKFSRRLKSLGYEVKQTKIMGKNIRVITLPKEDKDNE